MESAATTTTPGARDFEFVLLFAEVLRYLQKGSFYGAFPATILACDGWYKPSVNPTTTAVNAPTTTAVVFHGQRWRHVEQY